MAYKRIEHLKTQQEANEDTYLLTSDVSEQELVKRAKKLKASSLFSIFREGYFAVKLEKFGVFRGNISQSGTLSNRTATPDPKVANHVMVDPNNNMLLAFDNTFLHEHPKDMGFLFVGGISHDGGQTFSIYSDTFIAHHSVFNAPTLREIAYLPLFGSDNGLLNKGVFIVIDNDRNALGVTEIHGEDSVLIPANSVYKIDVYSVILVSFKEAITGVLDDI